AILRTRGDDRVFRKSSTDASALLAGADGGGVGAAVGLDCAGALGAGAAAAGAFGGSGAVAGAASRAGSAAAGLTAGPSPSVDNRDDGVHGNCLAFLDLDFGEHSRCRGRYLGIHFIGGDFKQRLIAFDCVADLLEPSNDGSLSDRLSHLRHLYFFAHVSP